MTFGYSFAHESEPDSLAWEATVKIYAAKNHVNGTAYQQFTLAYYDGTQRCTRRFADLEEAKREAELAATKLANGEGQVLRLTSLDRANCLQALDTLRPLGHPLNLAVAEYADAIKLLPQGVSLHEAVTDFARRTNTVRESRNVPALVIEYIATKEKAGKSEAHLRDMRGRLTRFGQAFQLPVAHVTGKMLQAWLDGMNVSNRTKPRPLNFANRSPLPPNRCCRGSSSAASADCGAQKSFVSTGAT